MRNGTAADAGGEKIELLLLKPLTFMNLSGEAVQGFSGFYKIAQSDLLVVADDVCSAGGHSCGCAATVRTAGRRVCATFRGGWAARIMPGCSLGVGGREEGREHPPQDLAGHVLSRFSGAEEKAMDAAVAEAVEACLLWARKGLSAAMNTYN